MPEIPDYDRHDCGTSQDQPQLETSHFPPFFGLAFAAPILRAAAVDFGFNVRLETFLAMFRFHLGPESSLSPN
jgi:hypothetical protein